MTERHLLRHLIVAVLLKLAVLATLWWLFVRDARVAVNDTAAARHLASAPVATPRQGARP